jgi:phasin
MIADAFQNVEVPEAVREFVKRAASTAKERVADTHAGAEKVTTVIETAAAGSVSESAKLSRTIQGAVYEDVQTLLSGIERLAAATSLNDAFHIQSAFIHERSEVAAARAKAVMEYLSKLVLKGAKSAQERFSETVAAQGV